MEAKRRKRGLWLPEDIGLRPMLPDDHGFLYELLQERYADPRRNILGMAAERLPSYDEHVAYLKSEPYLRIDVITADTEPRGIMFLNRRREAGCFVKDLSAGRGIGLAACYRFLCECDPPVHALLNPQNRPARRTVERLGFRLVAEHTDRLDFVLSRAPDDPFVALR